MVFRSFVFISILLLTIFPLSLNSQQISSEKFISQLREKGELDIFDDPTANLFRSVCSSVQSPMGKELQTLCEVVTSTDTCKAVEPCDLLNCSNMDDSRDFDIVDFFAGCTTGLFDSAKEILAFIWDTLKWVWNKTTHPTDTYQEASEYIESVKTYLVNEYDKAYDKADPPFRSIKAAKSVASAIANMLFKGIQEYLYKEYQEFGCLNFKARVKTICMVAGEFIIPPVAALALLKHGVKGVKQSKALKDFIKGEKNHLALNKRKQLGESSLGRTLTKQEVEALEKAHLVGKKEVGKNGEPASVGNYTLVQLKEKAEVLKEAGFSKKDIRKLMEDGVVGISSNGFARLFGRKKKNLETTGDSAYDRFRGQFNKGEVEKGDNQYISYEDLKSGERLPGRIVSIDKDKVSIETPEGEKYIISGEESLKEIRVSSTSKQWFNSDNKREQPSPGQDNAARRGSPSNPDDHQSPVVERRSPEYARRGYRLKPTGRAEYDDFREAFNSGKIEGDSEYVSVPYGSSRVSAKIIDVDGNRLDVDVLHEDGRTSRVVLEGRDLEEVRVSSNSKQFFAERSGYQNVPSVKGYDFSSDKVGDYKSRGGQIVRVDVDSPRLKQWMGEAADIIEEQTGIRPKPDRPLSSRERNEIYRVWLDDIVEKVESRERGNSYGDARNRIIGKGGDVADLGEILDENAAVCRELSMFGSVLFSEYGLTSKVVTGNVYTRANEGGHAWIQIYDGKGNPLEIIDSNNTRSIHPDVYDYDRMTQGVDVLFETPLMRVH